MLQQHKPIPRQLEYNTHSTSVELVPCDSNLTNPTLVLDLCRQYGFEIASEVSVKMEKEIYSPNKQQTLVVYCMPKNPECRSLDSSEHTWKAIVYEKKGKDEHHGEVLTHLPIIKEEIGSLFAIRNGSISIRSST